MPENSTPGLPGASARVSRLWLKVCRLSRVPVVLAALWFGMLFCGTPQNATACVAVEYNYYLSVPGDDPVNVTNTLYTSNGQTYVVYNGPIAVSLDYQDGHIYDLYNNIIGTIITIQGGENP